MAEGIVVTTEDGVRLIRIDRVDKKNALTAAMYAAMFQALAEGESDEAVRVFLISGTAEVFSAGNDLAEFMAGDKANAKPAEDFLRALARMPKPVVAAVNGAAVGVGATMLLHCDLIYAAASAVLQFPFINLALVAEAGSTLLLPRLLGHQRAAELIMLGDPIDAATAQAIGLINRVVADGELAALVGAVARRLADKPAAALIANKALLKREGDTVAQRMTTEFEVFADRLRSPEVKEAVTAFFERRPPNFRNLG